MLTGARVTMAMGGGNISLATSRKIALAPLDAGRYPDSAIASPCGCGMILVPASAATIAPSYGYGGGVNCNAVENAPVNNAVLSVVAQTGDMDMCYSAWAPL
jgi:hypothetical protein